MICIFRRSAKRIAQDVNWNMRHISSRNVDPTTGQRWLARGKLVAVVDGTTEGTVILMMGGVIWSESREQWAQRVSRGRLYLSDTARPPLDTVG